MKIFPVLPNSKTPALRQWGLRASDNEADHIEWKQQIPGCNFAVACGPSELVVVDVDNGGEASFFELDLKYGFPKTKVIRTPSGGFHYYFKGQSRNRVRMLPGIDVRSKGGYVLAEGSTIEGVKYEPVTTDPIAEAPKWLLDMIGRPKENDLLTSIDSVDNLADVRRAAIFLSSCPPAIEGEGGDHHTFKTACQTRDLGISPELCLEMMLEHFSPRCIPEWDAEALKIKIDNAYKYASRPLGSDSMSAVFDDESPEPVFKPVSEFGHHYPPREWVAENWFPKGASTTTLFTGDGATGKSLLALQLGVAVATGSEWLNSKTEKMPVLFLTCEDDEKELNRRLHAIRKEYPFIGIDEAPLYLMPRAGQESILCCEREGIANKGPFYDEMAAALAAFKTPEEHGLWIVDTVADVYTGNENVRSAVNGFLKNIIGKLTKDHNCTCILIAHPAKATGSTYAGNTAWHNSVRNRVFLQWLKTGKTTKDSKKIRTLTHEKANYTGGANEVLLEWVDGVLVQVQRDDVDAVIDNALYEAIAEAHKLKCPLSPVPQAARYYLKANITDSDGNPISAELLRAALDRLLSSGLVARVTGEKRGNGLIPISKTTPPK